MPVHKLQSSKRIIAQVYQDLHPEDEDFELDALDWIGLALGLIGAAPQYEDKRTNPIEVENHKASLPCDLLTLKQVGIVENPDEDEDEYIVTPMISSTTTMDLPSTNNDRSNIDNKYRGDQEEYTINGNYIITENESPTIIIYYRGMPLDDDGDPMIPDDASYSQALYWFIAGKLLIRGSIKPMFSAEYATAQWHKYCAQSYASALYPSIDDYEAFSRSWTRMLSERHHHDAFYKYLGHRGDTSAMQREGQYGNKGIV